MLRNNLLLCPFVISACLLAGAVAREAIVRGISGSGYPYPYQVSVQLHDRGHVCGGGIIGDRFILTAAHCVLNRTRRLRSPRISIVAGTLSLNASDPYNEVTIRVEEVFFSSEFHPTIEFNYGDIAVLRLADSLELEHSERFKKLVLPLTYHLRRIATITGFGWNRYNVIHNRGVGSTDGILRDAVANVLSNDNCENAFPYGAIQTDKHICARLQSFPVIINNDRYGVCNGDDGGPLIRSGKFIVGVLSRIPLDCDERVHPGVYTRVSYYVSTIINVMQHNHDSTMISLRT